QLTQVRSEHLLRHVGHQTPQFPKALGSLNKVEDDIGLPLARNDFERCFHRTILFELLGHGECPASIRIKLTMTGKNAYLASCSVLGRVPSSLVSGVNSTEEPVMPKLFRVILPVSNIETAAKFYALILGLPGERVSPGRHYFNCDGTILA